MFSFSFITYLSHDFKLRKGARAARGDDAANLKPAIVSWVLDLVLHPHVLLSPTNKSERGFENDATGRLLCPIEYTWLDDTCVHYLKRAEILSLLSFAEFDRRSEMDILISISLLILGRHFSTRMLWVM